MHIMFCLRRLVESRVCAVQVYSGLHGDHGRAGERHVGKVGRLSNYKAVGFVEQLVCCVRWALRHAVRADSLRWGS